MSKPEIRQRAVKSTQKNESLESDNPAAIEDGGRVLSIMDIIRVIVTLIGLSSAASYYVSSGESLTWGYSPWFFQPAALARYVQGPLTLTPAELANFDGTDPKKPIFLAINGTIFDVSAGRNTYGPGGSYAVFAGRDATRAFVTGCFLEDRTSDLRGAEEIYIPVEDPEEEISSGEKKKRAERERREAKKKVLQEVKKWVDFYGKSKKYFEVGKLVGVEEPTGDPPSLCEPAQKGRPKRKNMVKSANDSPGKPVQ